MKQEKLTPRLLWEKVKELIVYSQNGVIIFADTVLDKSHSFAINGVRRQYSGNAHSIIKGIGMVNCVYYNPELNKFGSWINDLTQSETEEAQKVSSQRWKMEQFHREIKQITGIERCQCQLNRSQRNHIAAAMLVW